MSAPARCCTALVLLAASSLAAAQSIVQWTQGPGRLGLGYPVPTSVDTPLPFDGFRSYAGLHTRHQDLALVHDFVEPAIVGETLLGRDIWAYRLGRGGETTPEGLPRAVLQFTGGIHAREWQSPEVVTGLMELLAEGREGKPWLDYVLDHTSIVVIPVLNIDGFLQTQRFPTLSWLDVDNRYPDFWARDGRMRRKNHRGADESLFSAGDRLAGVDLNRNNPPFWPGPPFTEVAADLTYRGPSPGSEPEIQALRNAAGLGPADQLRFYADMHSFTRVFFSVRTGNQRLNAIQQRVLAMASDHHVELPGSKRYLDDPGPINGGIGTTSEYFAHTYQVPSLTWEIEPGEQGGEEYGGFGTNGGDGFILPESEITRVRENLAETMAAVAYHMAGPAHVLRADLLDETGSFTLWTARWQTNGSGQRELVTHSARAITPGRAYRLRLTFSKPMRWRENGEITPFPGQDSASLDLALGLEAGGESIETAVGAPEWQPDPSRRITDRPAYPDDTVTIALEIPDSTANLGRFEADEDRRVTLAIDTTDLTGHRLDADPATPVAFSGGRWQGLEGGSGPDVGGTDRSLAIEARATPAEGAQAIAPGHTAMWFNPDRSGEGWMLEILPDNRALAYWFTFDGEGRPRWLIGSGTIEGNTIEFPELIAASGARFGGAFDPGDVEFETVGSARMVFADCQAGWYEYEAYGHHRSIDFIALTTTWETGCHPMPVDVEDRARWSGSWYDPQQAGQGLTVQWVSPESMLLVWFTFDAEGRPYWVIGQSEAGSTDPIFFPEALAVRGPVFGDGFDPDAVEQFVWGQGQLSLDCAQGEFDYQSQLEDFENGTLPLERLTELAGLNCP
ncbi:MAG: hypothetical protein GVY32_03645 [Gammaproteobacteria bacterium]|jgi:hypothetical protein|nr:hypothetical protein [Gammaproteobacteria bacterium]